MHLIVPIGTDYYLVMLESKYLKKKRHYHDTHIKINTEYTQRMLRIQKLTRNLFLILHGHNVHRLQRQLSKFIMRYQQFASHAYCGTAGPVSKMASHQEKAFCVLRFEVSRSYRSVFFKPCTKLTLHCNHKSGHLKTEHTETFFLLRRHFGNWPRSPALSMRSELLVAHDKLGQLPLLTV